LPLFLPDIVPGELYANLGGEEIEENGDALPGFEFLLEHGAQLLKGTHQDF
jgi:hypothetical protein